jgi:RNA polymerase sigma-70 factor (ECF subfamily)
LSSGYDVVGQQWASMTTLPEPPDEHRTLELVQKLQRGETAAFSELYGRFRDDLLFAIRVRMGAGLRAAMQSEDVLQSVALDAFQALPGFQDRGKGSLRAFLRRLVENKLRDRARGLAARKRSGSVPLDDALAEQIAVPALPTYHDARYDRLERALAALPAEMREIVLLRRIDGLDSKSAAERMGRSDDAVRKLYSRAIARLSTIVQGQP